jgi:hypothetical protein
MFRFAKKRGLIFANPTTGLKARPADFALLPMTDEEIHAVEQLATDPAWRVIVALAAAENAARTGAIRRLKLVDVDLANHRITFASRRQRLGTSATAPSAAGSTTAAPPGRKPSTRTSSSARKPCTARPRSARYS